MKKLLLACVFALVLPSSASATWSIIAMDLETGRVVISSATCAAQGPDQLMQLQAIVIPGIGVAAAQAGVDRTQANHRLIFEEMQKRTHPEQIIRMLESDPSIESRQFGIVDALGRSAGRTGSNNRDVALNMSGETEGGVLWSVQGNIIASNEALTEAARVMQESDLDMVDRVMAAMEEADALGGDSRCTCESEPLPGAQCTGKTSHVAYILAADPEDPMGRFHVNHPEDLRAPYNNGDYHLYLAVWPDNTEPHEDANPVRTLRMRYDAWKERQAGR
ncbi:MAG: DUF1028 domain-containing protein [Gemmatimonadota bacterium]|nr:DUF1028 domain-containing protein [Gemmatimonadota bacterium]